MDELLSAFICDNNNGIRVNNLFAVKTFNHVPSSTSSSSLSKSGIDGEYSDLSSFSDYLL